jgi:hypothetical protein
VIDRQRQRLLDGFAEVIESFHRLDDVDLDELAAKWREVGSGTTRAALGYEFTLFLLRYPEARERLATKRRETVRSLGEFIGKHVAGLGATLTMPAETLARVILAVNDGVTLGSQIDGEDLYRPYLQLVISSIAPTPASP